MLVQDVHRDAKLLVPVIVVRLLALAIAQINAAVHAQDVETLAAVAAKGLVENNV